MELAFVTRSVRELDVVLPNGHVNNHVIKVYLVDLINVKVFAMQESVHLVIIQACSLVNAKQKKPNVLATIWYGNAKKYVINHLPVVIINVTKFAILGAVGHVPILASGHALVELISVIFNVQMLLKHVLVLVERNMKIVNTIAQINVTRALVHLAKCRLKKNVNA